MLAEQEQVAEPVFSALDDQAAREVLAALTEPMTAKEIASESDMALSTTYKKLGLLTDADLVSEDLRVRPDGHHLRVYRPDFDAIHVIREVEADRARLTLRLDRPGPEPQEQLARLWGRMREEVR